MNKNDENRAELRSFLSRLYGGLNMSWPVVIAMAVGSAIITAVFLILPLFKNTSFERMGVYLEAWFFLAILIMSNCKKPLESAQKTFVFFLVSQPLIYLIQVPFSSLGWGLFGFYRYWFILTLLTFPMAYIGWFITKKNWLSVLILSPVLAFMGVTACQSGLFCFRHAPHLLVTAVFCLLQILIYVTVFFPDLPKRVVGILIAVIAAVTVVMTMRKVEINGNSFLPDNPVLTEAAVVEPQNDSSDDALAVITIERTGEDSMVRIQADSYGEMDFSIRDGDMEYLYTLEIYEDDTGHNQIRIRER